MLNSPKQFPLWDEEQAAADCWLEQSADGSGSQQPVTPRPASAIVLLRDSPRSVETALQYCTKKSPLGKLRFPGSCLAAEEGNVELIGPSLAQWASILETPDLATAEAHLLAAARSCFAVTGVLLAGTDQNSAVSLSDSTWWRQQRDAVAEGSLTLTDLLSRQGLALRGDLLRPLLQWESPDFAHQRFRIWYFAAIVPQGQSLSFQEGGTARWVSPRQLMDPKHLETGFSEVTAETMPQLMNTASQIILEKLTKVQGTIALFNQKRQPAILHPRLVVKDAERYLEI